MTNTLDMTLPHSNIPTHRDTVTGCRVQRLLATDYDLPLLTSPGCMATAHKKDERSRNVHIMC